MPRYFELEVSLVGVRPKIWRRFFIAEGASFADLHDAIQIACGWTNSHLYLFQTSAGTIAMSPDAELEVDEEIPFADEIFLKEIFGHRKKCRIEYEYDFGDSWLHAVDLLGSVELAEKFKRRLVDGARAFPPEDAGGLIGYRACADLTLGRARSGEDTEDLRAWLGHWHPERFDVDKTRRAFDRPRSKRPPLEISPRVAPPPHPLGANSWCDRLSVQAAASRS